MKPFVTVASFAIVLLIGMANPVSAKETQGAIKFVQDESKTFVLIDKNLNEQTFRLADNGRVVIRDRDATLSDLESGQTVRVTWEEQNGEKVASLIEFMSP